MNERMTRLALVGLAIVAVAYVAIPAIASAQQASVYGKGSDGYPRPIGAEDTDRLKTAAKSKLKTPDGGLVDQAGTPEGAAKVDPVGIVRSDAGAVVVAPEGGSFPMSQPVCASAPQTIVIVGTTAAQVPTSQLAGRKALRVCVSLENAASPKVKCLLDGTPGMTFTPDVGVAQGDVMGPGDCYVYPVDTSHTVKCISDTASTGVLTWEC